MAVITATYSQSSTYTSNNTATFTNMTDGSADGANGNGAAVGGAGWIKADMGTSKTVKAIVVGADINNNVPGGWGTYYAKNLSIQGSNDDSNWTTLGITPAYDTTVWPDGFYTLLVNVTYRYIRLYNASDYFAVTEFRLMDATPTLNPAVSATNGAYSNNTSYVSLPAHSTGDIIILALMNNSQTTAPSVPSGFTDIISSVNGYNGSYPKTGLRVCYKMATSTNSANAVSLDYYTGTNANSCVVNVIKNVNSRSIGNSSFVNDTGGYVSTWNGPSLTLKNTREPSAGLVMTYTTANTSWSISMVSPTGTLSFQTGYSPIQATAVAKTTPSSTTVPAKTFNQSGGAGFYNVVTAAIEILPAFPASGFFAMF